MRAGAMSFTFNSVTRYNSPCLFQIFTYQPNLPLSPSFYSDIKDHECYITSIAKDHDHGLPPEDGLINQDYAEDNHSDAIDQAIACDGIPGRKKS